MPPVRACALPDDALLARYAGTGAYTDCYATDLARPVAQADYVEAFYVGRLFRLERWLLARFLHRPSTDAEAKALATGARDTFAAWHVEDRRADQLLLCDLAGRTRSWLMVAPHGAGTRLYFGSAVVPRAGRTGGLGFAFHALAGFHTLYSRALLSAARSRLARGAAIPAAA
jgi:hypothetical protein